MADNRKLGIVVVVILAIVAVGALVYAVQRRPQKDVTVNPPAAKADAPKPAPVAQTDPTPLPRSGFAGADDYDKLAKSDAAIKPSVPSYTVKPGLSNVSNLKLFAKALNARQKEMIARNGFVVSPTDYIQLFQVYENNEYQRPQKFPAFITTDAMLHTYHMFYDYSLRVVETGKLFDQAVGLTNTMLAASERDYAAAKDPALKDAARRNLAFFAVARQLLLGTAPPPSVADLANADLKKIQAHESRAISSVMGHTTDFTQFVPRGHYTRSDRLKKYFRAMMWYGLTAFPVPQKKIKEQPTRQAVLVVRNLRNTKVGDVPSLTAWDTIYEPTVFYVGKADDYTVYQYADLMDRVYGKNPSLEAFADNAKLKAMIAEVNKLPGPRIETYTIDPYYPDGRQFRLMGQRFIPDSRIMQELTHPKVNGRNFPKGLDVFAAMGSDRALRILESTYKVNAFDGFRERMQAMRSEMAATPPQTWQSNLYYGWMWALQALPKPAPQGYPSFMRNEAWIDKSLFTGLGSWTELRHDTILYAKQSVSECGGDGEEVPMPKGYVEPNLEFWTKLKWLNGTTRAGLDRRKLLTAELADKFDRLGDWIDFCRKITVKELTGKKVTEEEYQNMETFGADLEGMLYSFAGGDVMSDTDKDMAVIADVHTSFDKCMEEGTGRAAEIFVVVPIEGKLYLTRGAVYTQYEFEQPSANRLTDEQWQQMLKKHQEPGFAEWIDTFFIKKDKKPAPEFENYTGGC